MKPKTYKTIQEAAYHKLYKPMEVYLANQVLNHAPKKCTPKGKTTNKRKPR